MSGSILAPSAPPNLDDAVAPAVAAKSFQALEILSAGLCCSVGHDIEAASCALRANMDHFQTAQFVSRQGDPLVVARLPNESLWGHPRLVRWMAEAAVDCLTRAVRDPRIAWETVDSPTPRARVLNDGGCALLVIAPKASPFSPQAVSGESPATTLAWQVAQALRFNLHPASGVLSSDRAGLAQALELASGWLGAGEVKGQPLHSVLVLAADSLLDVELIDQFLTDDRLLCPGNRDGFVPGEAAAAILLGRSESQHTATAAAPAPPHHQETRRLCVVGVGEGVEPARWSGGTPNRSDGLTTAVRSACTRTGSVRPEDLRFRLSDQNGESFYSRESATAFTRLRADAPSDLAFRHLTIADKIGEVGAATGISALAWLSHLWQQQNLLPGSRRMAEWGPGVVHLSQDDGRRCAVIVEPR